MDLTHLQKLKNKIEHLKAEQAKCSGQKLQLDKQKDDLIKKFQELGVTKDTLPLMITQLEADITKAESEIDLILNSIYGQRN